MLLLMLLLAAAVIAYAAYSHFVVKLREIDPDLLNYQSSISETRKENETPIYRSVDAPHGVGVTRGLNLRSGYKIRDGCLKDFWYSAMKRCDEFHIQLGNKSFTIGQINRIIHEIDMKLKNITQSKKIAVFGDLDQHPELILPIWAAFFISDHTVVLYSSNDDFKSKENDIDTVFVASEDVSIKKFFKNVIPIGTDIESENSQGINISTAVESLITFDYDPDNDFGSVNNNPLVVINQGVETKFYQLNFVSAIASKIMSIPSKLAWNDKDTLLISYTNTGVASQINRIFHSCCGLISQVSSIQFVTSTQLRSLKDLAALKPTILCIDSKLTKILCSSSKKSFWKSFVLQRSEYFNSLGYTNSFGRIEKSLKLKTVFASQLAPPLSSFICNFCKSVLGCRIVREVYTDFTIGPILKTNIYDFRVVHNGAMALYGVPANSVELKVIKPSEDDTKGRLMVRGMSVGKNVQLKQDEEMWVDTGMEGTFAKDGCFYGI